MVIVDDILARYGAALTRVAASYERSPALREELLQEIAIAIHNALPRLEDPAKLKAFVFRIAHNRAVSHVVNRVREPAFSEVDDDLPGDHATPEDKLLEDEQVNRLMTAVRRLPLPYRQVMTLLLEDLSYADISDILGITLSNVGVRINRGKALLKEALSHD